MLVLFLEGSFPDYNDRYIADIWKYTDDEIESVHDYIQWLFPLDKASRSVPHSPILIDDEIYEIRASQLAKKNLLRSKEWFLKFLSRSEKWTFHKDHNQKRISRMIRSLRLLHSASAADECTQQVVNLVSQRDSVQMQKVVQYWRKC